MPVVEIKWWKGRTPPQKEETAKRITDVFASMGIPADQVWIIFHDVPREDWSIAGRLQG